MGWDFSHATYYKNGKVDRKAECDDQFTWGKHNVVRSSMKGTTYYAAVDNGEGVVFGVVALTAGQCKDDPYFNFGIKSMDETMHPYFYDCPKAILDLLTPTDNENALKWRAKCREPKEKNWLNALPIGSKVVLTSFDGTETVLIKHAPAYQFRTWFWYDQAKHKYIQKKYVTIKNVRRYEE